MIQTSNNPQLLEQQFYERKFDFSYSSLNRLLFSPRVFYKEYVLGQKENKTDSHIVEGRAVHCLLLENGKFEKQFTVMPGSIPGDNNKKITEAAYAEYLRQVETDPESQGKNLADLETFILEYLKKINLHQTLKTDQQRMDKILTDQNQNYFEYLKVKDKKDILDEEMLETCKLKVDAIKNHKEAYTFMGLATRDFELFKVENEKPLRMDSEYDEFGLKGVLDNLTVDYEAKRVLINDLKTTGKPLTEFTSSVEYYNYWIQCVIYVRLVREYLKDIIDESWVVEYRFIVVDNYLQVYPFPVSETSLMEWNLRFLEVLKKAAYHYRERDYNLPYEFATGAVYL